MAIQYNLKKSAKSKAKVIAERYNYKQEVNIEVFILKIITDTLNIRKGPGIYYDIVGQVKKDEAYTITKTNVDKTWERLTSGAGWINITSTYVKKYKTLTKIIINGIMFNYIQ